jgi:putative nucleotidyltransferase with HDIG domain
MSREPKPAAAVEVHPSARVRRRPRRKRRLELHDVWLRSFDHPWPWLALFVLLGTWSLGQGGFLFAPQAQAGDVADRDYVASRDLLIADEEATRAKQNGAREAVLPVYDLDSGLSLERDRVFAEFFSRGRQELERLSAASGPRPSGEAGEQLARSWTAAGEGPEGLRLTRAQIAPLARRSFSSDLEDRVRGLVTQVLRRGVVDNKALLLEQRLRGITVRDLATGLEAPHLDLFGHLGYPSEVQETLELEVRGWSGWNGEERRQLVGLLVSNLTPNLLLNRRETLSRQQAATAGVARVLNQLRRGQVIVRKGDVIDASHARVIAQLHGDRRLARRLPALLATLALLALAAGVPFLFARGSGAAGAGSGRSRRRRIGESLFLLAVALPGLKFFLVVGNALSNVFDAPPFDSGLSYAYAAPYAAFALLAALLIGRQPAILLASLFAVLVSRFEADGLWMTIYAFTGSMAAIYALDRLQFRHRLVTARVGLVVGAVNVAMVFILTALAGWGVRNPMQVGFDLVCALASGLLVSAVASFALPILEWLLGVTTDIKLVELSNTNLPLLRRVAFEAPGTFQHSLMVANLAKEGSEAIAADPVLAYAAGLYHDVGKVVRPDYFIENQRGGQNRHDRLLPSMSALILASHIRDGLELGRAHGLPQALLDAIGQHHGTRLMRFFFNRALEARGAHGADLVEVSEEGYRYPGPKPQSKVMGVLMLADAVEAASRTLAEPTAAKIRSLIHTIVDDCLRDGQLDHTDLTLADLRLVAEAFERVLGNIFHQRVDYPGFDFNAQPRSRPRIARHAS